MVAKLERNLFGQLLCVALNRKIDIADVVRYPLSPIPLSLAHTDGTKHSTQKDRLRKILEGKILSMPPSTIDYYIIDGVVAETVGRASNAIWKDF